MMRKMRAKMKVGAVLSWPPAADGSVQQERLQLHGVAAGKYPDDGSDENNTFAKFSPAVSLDITIANPALIGSFKAGDTFYVDFTPAD